MRGRNKEHTTIIKRSSRKSHDAFHGGAWKVAFADFTLAMMALFMVLWIMGAVTEEEILHFCEEKLAKYKVPKKACFLEELPRNASKKLLRRELRQLVEEI